MLHTLSGAGSSLRRVANELARLADAVHGAADHIPMPAAWRWWWARRVGRAFDRTYRTDTQSRVEVAALGVEPDVAAHAVWYEPSAIPKVRRALRHLGVRYEDFDFIDVGSGKGIVPLLAAGYPFRTVIGIEASPELHRIAEGNLVLYRARAELRAPVRLLNMDVAQYEISEANQVVYLYNPFDDVTLARFVGRLLRLPPSVTLVVAYVNPVHSYVFENAGVFRSRFSDGSVAIYVRSEAVE